jgi:hypothetical protein
MVFSLVQPDPGGPCTIGESFKSTVAGETGVEQSTRGGGMVRAMWAVAIVTLAAVVAIPAGNTFSSNETACPERFVATSGSVQEADSNGDAITCDAEVTVGSQLMLASVDNSAPSSAVGPCPDDFSPMAIPPGEPPDRNGNGMVCVKLLPSDRVPAIAIDDARSASGAP